MDMIVAFVVLVLSVCLMIVSFAVLKFTITFTVTEEYREIGVMKAIGITDFKIRSLYLVKYLMLAVVGAAIGFLASIPSVSYTHLKPVHRQALSVVKENFRNEKRKQKPSSKNMIYI